MIPDITKLPQWAQRLISSLKRDACDAREELKRVIQAQDGSDPLLSIGHHEYPDSIHLPGNRVNFFLGEHPGDDWSDYIETVKTESKTHGNVIEVRGGCNAIKIMPKSGNVVQIGLTDF